MLTPLQFLSLLIAITAMARLAYVATRGRRRRALRRLAAQWQMRYVPQDVFKLAQRIAGDFPVPGAADLRVRDLVYGMQGERHRYIFTAEYTIGAIYAHHRERRVMTFCEGIEHSSAQPASPLVLASEELPLLGQYKDIYETRCRPAPPAG